ncbi:hypothetical protein [Promicromonospora sp. NPDC023987]
MIEVADKAEAAGGKAMVYLLLPGQPLLNLTLASIIHLVGSPA